MVFSSFNAGMVTTSFMDGSSSTAASWRVGKRGMVATPYRRYKPCERNTGGDTPRGAGPIGSANRAHRARRARWDNLGCRTLSAVNGVEGKISRLHGGHGHAERGWDNFLFPLRWKWVVHGGDGSPGNFPALSCPQRVFADLVRPTHSQGSHGE